MPENYKELISALLERNWLKHPASRGIAKQAIDQGIESLTPTQLKVLKDHVFQPFERFAPADFLGLADMGYDGKNSRILECAKQIKASLGYIPDGNAKDEDRAYRSSMEETYL
jgi:hypothetical protein